MSYSELLLITAHCSWIVKKKNSHQLSLLSSLSRWMWFGDGFFFFFLLLLFVVVVDLAGGGWWVDVVVGGAESSWVEREREREYKMIKKEYLNEVLKKKSSDIRYIIK